MARRQASTQLPGRQRDCWRALPRVADAAGWGMVAQRPAAPPWAGLDEQVLEILEGMIRSRLFVLIVWQMRPPSCGGHACDN